MEFFGWVSTFFEIKRIKSVSDVLIALLSDTTGAVSKYLNIVLKNGTSIFSIHFQCNAVPKMSPVTKMFLTPGLNSKAQKVSTFKDMT